MPSWEAFVELRNLHERGWSIAAIARHLGKDRNTIRRYLADPDARPGVRRPVGRLVGPYAALQGLPGHRPQPGPGALDGGVVCRGETLWVHSVDAR
jgi:Helix-turn-helix domain